jgi:mono/diheme cytochrome c family protein
MLPDLRSVRAALLGAGLAGAVALSAPSSLQAQDSTAAPPPARTSADSTFTVEQAERGEQVFTRSCVECHERLEMANNDFRLKWGGQSTFDLFKNIATTMPDSDPGVLPRNEYTDVVAYILKLNGVPAGTVELVEDSTSMSQAKLNLPPAPSSEMAVRRRPSTTRSPLRAHQALGRPSRAPHATSFRAAVR